MGQTRVDDETLAIKLIVPIAAGARPILNGGHGPACLRN
jgi:hypothetical protein